MIKCFINIFDLNRDKLTGDDDTTYKTFIPWYRISWDYSRPYRLFA